MIPRCIYCDHDRPIEAKNCPSCGAPQTYLQARANLAYAVADLKADIDKAFTTPLQKRVQVIIWRVAGFVGRFI